MKSDVGEFHERCNFRVECRFLQPKVFRLRVGELGLSVVAHGEIEGLGTSPHFKAKDERGQTLADVSLGDATRSFGHAEAFAHLAHWAYEHFAAELVPLAVGHRVVHGGLTFSEPTLIDAAVMTTLEQLIPLVPLHQPYNLEAIKAVMRLWPDLPQVACFDTAFHCGRAQVTERFSLPDELFRRGVPLWVPWAIVRMHCWPFAPLCSRP